MKSKLVLIFILVLMICGCGGTSDRVLPVVITNKTGHHNLYVKASNSMMGTYIDDNQSIVEYIYPRNKSIIIEATKEEFDTAGKVIWGYYFNEEVDYYQLDDFDWLFGDTTVKVDLTLGKNLYKSK